MFLKKKSVKNTYAKKIDVCLVVDNSYSLNEHADLINSSLKKMIMSIKQSPYLTGCEVYLTLLAFNETITTIYDFSEIDSVKLEKMPTLTFTGATNPAPALEYVSAKAYQRYYSWKNNGIEAFHPLLYFFTDGEPYPVENYMPAYESVAATIKDMDSNKKLLVIGAGFGSSANIDNIRMLTADKERVIAIKDNDTRVLEKFFSEIIPKTVHSTITNEGKQIYDIMRGAIS